MKRITGDWRKGENTTLRLSAENTRAWANETGRTWPHTRIGGHALRAEFDPRGNLVDVAYRPRTHPELEPTVHEFNAICSDFLRAHDPSHPAIRS